MDALNTALKIVHIIGLTMGMSVTFGNLVMNGLIAKAAPAEKAVLGRFPAAISKVGHIGLVLLLVTGPTMAYTKWNGIAAMPWTFDVKLAAVFVLTMTVLYITSLERKIQRGDATAMARIQSVAPLASLCALIAVIFAVITFK